MMAKQTINIGSSANRGDGDPLRTAFRKVNENFTELPIRIVSAPASSLGESTNKEGDVALTSSYIYYCTADYDGSTNIWRRIAWSNDTW